MAPLKNILKAALLVSTLDICAAFIQVAIQTGKSPFKPVLGFVASGLLGKNTGMNESLTMVAGLLIHYLIATTFTFFFFLVVAKFSFARNHRLLTGIVYGAFIWM